MKTLELHYPMIQFLIIIYIYKNSNRLELPVHVFEPSARVEELAGHSSHCKEPSCLLMNPISQGLHVFVGVS